MTMEPERRRRRQQHRPVVQGAADHCASPGTSDSNSRHHQPAGAQSSLPILS